MEMMEGETAALFLHFLKLFFIVLFSSPPRPQLYFEYLHIFYILGNDH
jgi:hypothetical protein